MHGTVKVNHNKLPWATGEASTAELVGVAYARASKPTNASAASCPGAGDHNYKGAFASAVLSRLDGGNRGHQDDVCPCCRQSSCSSGRRRFVDSLGQRP